MDTDHSTSANPSSACFRAKARAIGAVANWQLRLLENLFAMNVRDRRLGGRDEIQLSHRRLVLPFLNGVRLVLELWELPDAHHALAPHNVGRRDLRVAVLRRVKIEEKLNQRAFQPGTPVRVEEKPAPRKLRATSEIDQLELLADLGVRLGLERQRRFVTPGADHWVFSSGAAKGDFGVWQIRKTEQNGIESGFHFGDLFVEHCDAVADLASLLFAGLRFLDFFLAHQRADLFGDLVALGFKLLDLHQCPATLFIKVEDFRNLPIIPCPAHGETFTDMVRLFTYQFDVEHGRIMQTT